MNWRMPHGSRGWRRLRALPLGAESMGTTPCVCARACAISRQVMQEYATVGARWNAAQLDALLAVRDADGKPLGMARLVLIARAPAALRDDLLRLAARDALDVRQLRAHRRHRVQSALCAGPSGIVNPTTKN